MTFLQQVRTPQPGSFMAATLMGEATKPAICFRLNTAGKIEEGIKLELDHPRVGGKAALFVGDYFIFLNYRYGAAYDSNGMVRRAVIELKEREGKKPLELLTQPNGSNPPLLLHVDTSLPAGVKPKEHFWAGVDTDETIYAWSGKEILIAFSSDQAWADVFYADGSVKRVIRMGPKLVVQQLSLEEQAERRIEQALWNMNQARTESDNDKRIPREDRSLHQLIAVLAIGGARSELIFNQVYDLLKKVAREGEMRPRVLTHAKEVIRERFRDFVMEFDDLSLASRFADHVEFCVDAPVMERRSTPSERKARLAERAERDQQARLAMRGSGADQSLKGKKGDNKKKK